MPPEPTPPVASFTATPASVTLGGTIAFDASASSDADGTIVDYAWDFTSDGTIDESGVVASWTPNALGTFTVALVKLLPPAGSVSPLVAVSEAGRTATVRNAGTRPLSVHVTRSATLIWNGEPTDATCYMAAKRHGLDYTKWTLLAPNETETFEIPFDHPCEFIADTALAIALLDGDRIMMAHEPQLARLEVDARRELRTLELELERELERRRPARTLVDEARIDNTPLR